MVAITGSTLIRRPVEEVFDFVADERNEPTYNPRMVRAEKTTPGSVGTGTRWVATMRTRGRPLHMATEVTAYDRPCRLGSRSSMVFGTVHGEVSFQPAPRGDPRALVLGPDPGPAARPPGPAARPGRPAPGGGHLGHLEGAPGGRRPGAVTGGADDADRREHRPAAAAAPSWPASAWGRVRRWCTCPG